MCCNFITCIYLGICNIWEQKLKLLTQGLTWQDLSYQFILWYSVKYSQTNFLLNLRKTVDTVMWGSRTLEFLGPGAVTHFALLVTQSSILLSCCCSELPKILNYLWMAVRQLQEDLRKPQEKYNIFGKIFSFVFVKFYWQCETSPSVHVLYHFPLVQNTKVH